MLELQPHTKNLIHLLLVHCSSHIVLDRVRYIFLESLANCWDGIHSDESAV